MKYRHPLVVKLKSGEYDGADIMAAWLLIEQQAQWIAVLKARVAECDANHFKLVPLDISKALADGEKLP